MNSLSEVTNPASMNSFARFTFKNIIYSAEAFGNVILNKQIANIRVGTEDGIFPKLKLIEDVTTWIPGEILTYLF